VTGVAEAAQRALAKIERVPVGEARARITRSFGTLEAVDARRCRLVSGGSSLDGLAVWLAMVGRPFEVERPPELAEPPPRAGRAAAAGLGAGPPERPARAAGAPTHPLTVAAPPAYYSRIRI
jgi:hypothetical protein